MICFRDRTYCESDCTNESCPIRLTREVLAEARAWWGKEGAPIATTDFSGCCDDYVTGGRMIDYQTRYAFLREMLLFAKQSIDNELPSCALLELDKAARWIDSWDMLDSLDKVEVSAPDHMFSNGDI